MIGIRSKKHKLSIDEVQKIALSPFDSKRYYFSDGIVSLAFGHYKTKRTNFCKENRKKCLIPLKNLWVKMIVYARAANTVF